MRAATHDMAGGIPTHFMTLTPKRSSTPDYEFLRMSSYFIICMNEHLFGKAYGSLGNDYLIGCAYLERTYRHSDLSKAIEAATKRPLSLGNSSRSAPLHVHCLLDGLDMGGMSIDEQQDELRAAMSHAIDKCRVEKLTAAKGTQKQIKAIESAVLEFGRNSVEARRAAKIAATTPFFDRKGVDIRPIYDPVGLKAYVAKQISLYSCQSASYDFIAPIDKNGIPTAIH